MTHRKLGVFLMTALVALGFSIDQGREVFGRRPAGLFSDLSAFKDLLLHGVQQGADRIVS